MNWRIKGSIQRLLGHVPGGERLHFRLQRLGGGLSDFSRECDGKIEDWGLMMGHLQAAGVRVAGASVLEMGTGWYPTFPVCLFLAGAARVVTMDLNTHLDAGLTRALVGRLAGREGHLARLAGVPERDVAARRAALAGALGAGASLEAATGGAITYRAPADAAATGLPAASLDLVFSNNVLEHVPGPVVEACLAEALRILRPGAVAFHSVNCGDHYAYIDPSITQLNYLQYSEAGWRRWNNRFLYQNRLRAVDFVQMALRAGFQIELDTSRAKPELLERLDTMRVHPEFSRYPREQLAVTSVDLIARKPV